MSWPRQVVRSAVPFIFIQTLIEVVSYPIPFRPKVIEYLIFLANGWFRPRYFTFLTPQNVKWTTIISVIDRNFFSFFQRGRTILLSTVDYASHIMFVDYISSSTLYRLFFSLSLWKTSNQIIIFFIILQRNYA